MFYLTLPVYFNKLKKQKRNACIVESSDEFKEIGALAPYAGLRDKYGVRAGLKGNITW